MRLLTAGALVAGLVVVGSPPSFAAPGDVAVVAHGICAEHIATGADGNVWFTNGCSDSIGRTTPAGVLTHFTSPEVRAVGAIAPGPDGSLWFAAFNRVGRITPVGAISGFPMTSTPRDITTGSDGNLWLTMGTFVVRMTTSGSITTFDAGLTLKRITAGADGNLWFTGEFDGIGRITLGGVVTRFNCCRRPQGITVGPDGNLWFVTRGDDANGPAQIGRITPTGVTTFVVSTGAFYIEQDITTGPDGNLWFSRPAGEHTADAIGRVTPTGVLTVFSAPRVLRPAGIRGGPDGAVWFADPGASAIGRITSAGDISILDAGIVDPGGIALGSDGAMWFANTGSDSIGRVTPGGTVTTVVDAAIEEPIGITAGPDDNLWFTNHAAPGSIGRVTPGGVVTTFTDPGIAHPEGITVGPDGNLWFTCEGAIGRVSPAGLVTMFPSAIAPASIATGADGNLWFTDRHRAIGRLTTSGVFSSFAVPGNPVSIAAGPDGNLWFTDETTDAIGRMTPAGVLTTFGGASGRSGAITAGPDGNLWFAGGPGIGRITPAGVRTWFTGQVGLGGAAVGPDGVVWFTGGSIVKVEAGSSGLPGATTGVSATAGDGRATVTWTAAPDGGADIDGYVVSASPGGYTCAPAPGTLTCTVTGLTNDTAYTFTVTAHNANGTGPPSAPSVQVVPLAAGLQFHAIPAARLLDSRPGVQGDPNSSITTWGPAESKDVQVAGTRNIPVNAPAVVLNVSVTNTTAAGYLTIWPAGGPRPLASTLNWRAGQTIANAVSTAVGADRRISVFSSAGSTDVLVDVVGYFDGVTGAGFTPVTPSRIQDSRPAGPPVGPYATPWGAKETRTVAVAGVGGVPPDATAVVLNATVTGTRAVGYATLWPAGEPKPTTSTLNWTAGQTIPNAATVALGTAGTISVFTWSQADVILDAVGYFASGTGTGFHPIAPIRVQDSRPPGPQVGPYSTPWGTVARRVHVAGTPGIPANAAAVSLNVTVTQPTAQSYLTVWPAGIAAPLVSSLNYQSADTIANAVTVRIGSLGDVGMKNASGTVHVIADATGWYR
jgi:streptogramin lyase